MEQENKQVEERVSETILQKPFAITLGGKKYKVQPPTIGTIIEASAMVSTGKVSEHSMNILDAGEETLRLAKDYKILPKVIALFILGIKKAYITLPFIGRCDIRLRILAWEINRVATPEELAKAIAAIYGNMDAAFFLGIIDSLNAINQTRPTTGIETTALGQS